MKNNQFFVVTVLLSVVCASHVIKAHKDDILKPLHDKIKDEFINKGSAYVARQMKKNKPVSHDFQHFLDNDASMKKMNQTFIDGTGSFAFKVIKKRDEIIDDCKRKHDELNNDNEAIIIRKSTCKGLLGISALVEAAGLGLLCGTNKVQKIGVGMASVALVVGVGSWIGWSWYAEAQQEKQTHITEITKIEEKWERNFVEMEKQKNAKHNHVHPHTTTYN